MDYDADYPDKKVIESFKQLSSEAAKKLILNYEKEVDALLSNGKITQEEAWDAYFGLLHECDCREFWEDRERILSKINTKVYNPFESKNSTVRLIAVIRAQNREELN